MKQISDKEFQRHKCQLVQIPTGKQKPICNNRELATYKF